MLRQKKYLLKFVSLIAFVFTANLYANDNSTEQTVSTDNQNIVLLPASFDMYELGAVSVEKVPEWTEIATSMAQTTLSKYLPENQSFNVVNLPELSQEENDLVKEHVVLYDEVAGAAISMINNGGPAWKHKKTNFDYTLGSGLDFLREKVDADLALIYIGSDTVSTGGRVAMTLLLAAGGVGVPLTGPEIAVAGIVDLKTGEINWINYKVGFVGIDPRKEEGSTKIVKMVFDQYPGSRLLGKK